MIFYGEDIDKGEKSTRKDGICKPKEVGVLRVKHINFNKTLLGKWGWGLIQQHNSLGCAGY